MNKLLFKQIDNTGLVLWRAVFGLLITLEAFGAIATGWVKRTLVDPEFTFNFIGFEFLQPLPGNDMYFYFALMGVFGIAVMLGYRYRFSMAAYAVMWTCVYLMQKTSYNNHYYLMMLLCWIMVFLPASRWFSLDARRKPAFKSPSMPQWVKVVVILQVGIVYTYAAVAKFYPDWLDATVAGYFMSGKKHYWLIGEFLQQDWVHWCIAYFGIFFDLLIVPLLLCKRTRVAAFWISVFFHLFNSIVFQIGIFPYMSMAFAFFFFTPETLQRWFLRKRTVLYDKAEVIVPKYKRLLITIVAVHFAFQVGLPLRHWIFQDDVLWTEEAHRLSWRMMLRSKRGMLTVWVEDKNTGLRERYKYSDLLSSKQNRNVRVKPDLLWQLAQLIEKVEADKGRDVAVYMDVKVAVNGGEFHRLVDLQTDLAAEEWQHFKHHSWILPSPEDYHKKEEIK